MYGRNRNELRQFYLDAWRKHRDAQPLEPLERLVAAVIARHPEYHYILARPDDAIGRDYTPELGESNPFLHMGMHITLHEQITTDRPAGIGAVYRRLVMRAGNEHDAEHLMMECLGETLWEANCGGTAPDEGRYLEGLKRLL
ncbi:MAG: hypothetical protein FD165_1858 [Gammaproteobacteria bacterium]|nr:MAG: hypothetical protein FD165_1858 [Gammaproteobacteria bacterium]TND04431.1 MAG: hypothetical protein FD120_1545 [Gammaproteobacteria bacterium]